jgi:SAM-dependent methyltransferase
LDETLRARLAGLCSTGWEIFERFDSDVRDRRFHPFVAADYEVVQAALMAHGGAGLRFLELGSASGVISIMADLLGYEARGIEIDASLVATARDLATRYESGARFVAGSFLPNGYVFRPAAGDGPAWTLGGPSGYLELGHALDDFDVVFGYPWGGERAMMLDLMRCYGRADALLLLYDVDQGVKAYRGGREVPAPRQ